MKKPPDRWSTSHLPTDASADAEERAGLLLRRAIVRQPLGTGALAAVWRRLPDGRHAPRRRVLLRASVAIALFLSGGGVVISATVLGHWSLFQRSPEPPRGAPDAATLKHRRAIAAPAPAAVEAFVTPEPPAAAPTGDAPRRAYAARPVEVVGTPAPEKPTSTIASLPVAAEPARQSLIAEESALLSAAMRRLRERDDAAGALALLDEHDGRFGQAGTLSGEANTTRVEALLRLGRFPGALALLDAIELHPKGRDRELLATRGELRAEGGRCPEAISDFDALLGKDPGLDLVCERALYGRAACRGRLGESAAARGDLEAYLSRFPQGRNAARARAALDQ
jgi:hypothetical protein